MGILPLLFGLGITPLPAAQAAVTVQKVETHYASSTTFTSDFTQEYYVKVHGVRKSSSGHVTYSRPKVSWDYANGDHIVSDGTTLRVYEQTNRQMFVMSATQSQYPAALGFLETGTTKLSALYDFQLYSGSAMNFAGGDVLLGTPKSPMPSVAKVFYFVTPNGEVSRSLVVDGPGNRNRFEFTNAHTGVTVSAQTFVLSPPSGTTTITLP